MNCNDAVDEECLEPGDDQEVASLVETFKGCDYIFKQDLFNLFCWLQIHTTRRCIKGSVFCTKRAPSSNAPIIQIIHRSLVLLVKKIAVMRLKIVGMLLEETLQQTPLLTFNIYVFVSSRFL